MSTSIADRIKFDRGYWIKIAITFGIPVIIWFLPTSEAFTPEIRKTIALTFWFLAWAAFELSDLTIPALTWPLLLVLAGACSYETVYAPYLSSAVPAQAACFILFGALDRIGILKRIALTIARKSGGTFNKTVLAVFMTGFSLSIITFQSATFITAGLCYGMCKSLNLMRKKEGVIIMMAGMLADSTTRMFLYYPFTMTAMLTSIHTIDPNFNFGLPELFKYNWPVLLYCLLFIGLMLKFAVRRDGTLPSGKEYLDNEYRQLGPITQAEKKGFVVLLLVILWIVAAQIYNLDAMMGFVIGAAILYLPGVNLGTDEDVKATPLGPIFFFASCMAIGSVCVAVGITDFVSSIFLPFFANVGVVGMLFMILFFGIVANFGMTPIAMLAGFTGMFYAISVNLGINPLVAIFTFNHATDMVFFPYEYITFLIFYSFGCMSSAQFLKFHAAKNLLYIVFFAIIMIPYWFLVGLI